MMNIPRPAQPIQKLAVESRTSENRRRITLLWLFLFGLLFTAGCSTSQPSFLVEGAPERQPILLTDIIAVNNKAWPVDQTQPHQISVSDSLRPGTPVVFPAWCAQDEATLKENLELIEMLVVIDGEAYNLGETFGWQVAEAGRRVCAIPDAYILFPLPGRHQVQLITRLNSEISNGEEAYQPGDRVYTLDLRLK